MEPLHPNPGPVVLRPSAYLPARRGQRSVVVRALTLLPALVATPRRALFTGGVALGLAAPPVARFLAARAVESAARSLGLAVHKPRPRMEEVLVERVITSRVTMRRRTLWGG